MRDDDDEKVRVGFFPIGFEVANQKTGFFFDDRGRH